MDSINRRKFLKASSLTMLPALLPGAAAISAGDTWRTPPAGEAIVKFFGDGEMFSPPDYLNILQQVQAAKPIERDFYGNGGPIADIEKKFAEITGKEKAIFMPTGTMANQFAIAVHSADNAKVFVQETSHVFRDEADAAQTVYNKRLVPLAKGETYFTAAQLEEAVKYINDEEVFKSGMGCVSVENPVRRTDGRMIPITEIQKISAYSRKNNLRLHLDGARIFLASAWSGVSVREYASHFDSIYISLYKYLGANAGAMLCGDTAFIEKMPHLMKIHGGTMLSNWTNATMALNRLEGLEQRLQVAIKNVNELMRLLNTNDGVRITPLDGGTNIYRLETSEKTDGQKFRNMLSKEYNIRIPTPDEKGEAMISINESLGLREPSFIANAFHDVAKKAAK